MLVNVRTEEEMEDGLPLLALDVIERNWRDWKLMQSLNQLTEIGSDAGFSFINM